jgi:pimeloyl-ACP methyl ester carboxylesterase
VGAAGADYPRAMPTFEYEGQRLAYTEYGEGPRPCVLLHGLLLSQKMHAPLARALAERGNRAITLDLLGHGLSDRPPDMNRYSMPAFSRQTVALLDRLSIEQAVVLGTSLGANTALEIADRAPQRLRGMVVEMPVLDNALLACMLFFTPLLVAFTFGAPVMRVLQAVARGVPTPDGPFLVDIALDMVRQDPRASAAVLQGVLFSRAAPPSHARRTFQTPALVIGHPRDPVHPFSDSDQLVHELPNARLLRAGSILEMRLTPERLTSSIGRFVDYCWTTASRPAAAPPALS